MLEKKQMFLEKLENAFGNAYISGQNEKRI